MKSVFTIIVSVLDAAGSIQRCINSVANQTYPNIEFIIIDGGSTDGTVDVIKANDNLIDYWESAKDLGIYSAWNKALKRTSGDWIYFLGADDYLFNEDILECVYEGLLKAPKDCKIVYGRVCIVNKEGQVLFEKGEPWENFGKRSSYSMVIPHQGVFHHKDLFKEYGCFDESFKIAGDTDFIFRVIKNCNPFFLEDLTIAAMEYYGKSSNPKNKILGLIEVSNARRKNGSKPYTLLWVIEYIWALSIDFLDKIAGRKMVKNIVKLYCKLTRQPPYWEKY